MLAGCYVIAFLDRALVSVAGAPIKRDLGLSDSQFGLLSGTAFVVLYATAGLPLGWLADRIDRHRMIALAILIWSAMTAICGLAGTFPIFFAARIGVGCAEAALIPAGMSLLASTVPRAWMARSVALFLMGSAVGNALALLGGGYLLTRLEPVTLPVLGMLAPWQLLFLIACPPGLVAAVLMATVREPRRVDPGSAVGDALGHIAAHRVAYGLLIAASSCTVLLSQAPAAWMPLFYVRQFGLEPGPSAMRVGLMYVTSVPAGQLVGGMLTDRLGARGIAAAPFVAIALCALLSLPPAILFCTTRDLGLSQAAYVLFSFLVSAATPNGLIGLQLLTPERHQGITSALLLGVVSLIALGIGPAAVGVLSDHPFLGEPALPVALLTVIATAGLAAPLVTILGRRSFASAVAARS
jgi:MFS family permease